MKILVTRSLGSILGPNLCAPFADLGPDFTTPNTKDITSYRGLNMQIKISEQSIHKLKKVQSLPFWADYIWILAGFHLDAAFLHHSTSSVWTATPALEGFTMFRLLSPVWSSITLNGRNYYNTTFKLYHHKWIHSNHGPSWSVTSNGRKYYPAFMSQNLRSLSSSASPFLASAVTLAEKATNRRIRQREQCVLVILTT